VPDVPALPGLAGLTAHVFRAGGALSQALPDYEPRAGQAEMAARVAHVFENGGVLLAEAGTGTGKTLAYLVPAILSRQRVLVSTGTKNLQEQIYFKDIPTLRTALDVPFTATCMKGRANYLCLHRVDLLSEGNSPASHDVFLPIIRDWSKTTDTGDRAELEDLPEDLPFWSEVAATAEACIGNDCPRYAECFVTRMRQRAAESDVVIVNHHLLCADAAVRQNAFGEVIPACAYAVVDEAHQLEDVATQYFGFSLSTYRIEDYARDVERFIASGGVTTRSAQVELQKGVDRLRDHARSFFTELAFAHRSNERVRGEERVRATDQSLSHTREVAAYMAGSLDLLEADLALLAPSRSGDDLEPSAPSDGVALGRRAGEIRDELRFLLRAGDPAYVYFVEFRGKGIFLRASPIDVSEIVRDLLLDRVPRMPDPRSPEFTMAAGRQVVELLKRSQGRAFVLFTSYASLRSVQAIVELALEYPMLVQGTAPRSQLLTQFRETPNSVLFATSSFWQGVDVVGEALSCVIVDKLPFASPGDPITSARIEAIRARGGEPFDEYQVPLAILTLQQGLGRLIRHRHDRGVLAVLDPRMRTKGYGRRFLASVPPAPVVYDLDAVERFFSIV